MNEGLFLVRVVVGLVMAAHGSQKLFGWFGGYGIAGTGGYLESIGFRPGRVFAAAAGASEFLGGLLIAAGLLGPVGPALVLATMIVAAVSVHGKHGLFAANNGIEVPLLYAVIAAGLIFTGPGAYSFDGMIGSGSPWPPVLSWAALLVGVAGAVANLVVRRPVAAEV